MLMARGKMTPEEGARAALPFTYHPATPQRLIEEDLEIRKPWFPHPEAYTAQLLGILGWESYSRLSRISSPTLVIHGESDQLVPAANGRLIAEKVPGAKLVILPNAGHIFTTDQPDEALLEIMEFLANQPTQ